MTRRPLLLVLFFAGCRSPGAGDDSGSATDSGDGDSGDVEDTGQLPDEPVCAAWDAGAFAHVYDVGPGRAYGEPGEVPWESLGPGTLVRIWWREAPYAAKWVVNTEATEQEPLVVLGIPDAGRLPVITGEDAVTRLELSYWNEGRSVVKVGGSNLPTDEVVPAWITLQGLEIRGAHPSHAFTDDSGGAGVYADNAAAIHVEVGDHVTICGCTLTDSGNGLFAGSGSSDLIVRGSYIHGNGIDGSIYEHNSYTESLGITFEYNRYGPLRPGAGGNNLKDRSAGTVIRYNWIESGNRQLDLVETDYAFIRDDPRYRATFVYGNVLVEPDGAGNSQIVHYGGDGGDEGFFRKGTLHFFHNTVVSTRAGNTTLLRLSTADEAADVRNDVVWAEAGAGFLAISNEQGTVDLHDCWLSEGWVDSHGTLAGTVVDEGTVTGAAPGFEDAASQDFHLGAGSGALGGAGPLASGASAHPVLRQYAVHQSYEPRPDDGDPDIGAFERPGAR